MAFDENGKATFRHGRQPQPTTCMKARLPYFARTFRTNWKPCITIAAKAISKTSASMRGLGRNTRYVGWGCGFFDFDNDGWEDLFLVNGHAFPEIDRLNIDIRYRERAILYPNDRGRFRDISESAGPALLEPHSSRGVAFADYDNDGLGRGPD